MIRGSRGITALAAWLCVATLLSASVAQAAPHRKHTSEKVKRTASASRKAAAVESHARPAPDAEIPSHTSPPPPEGAGAAAVAAASGGSGPGGSAPPPSRGPTRIDFDDRLVTGQTNKTGSVYLYDRKELKTASMLKMRESFRDEIVGSVYDK